MKKILLAVTVVLLILTWGTVAQVQCEDLEWSAKERLNLETSPLDVATSADGNWIFVLVPEKVKVYSAANNRLVKEIPVVGQFDRVAHSPQDNTLVLSSHSGKAVAFIELALVYAFDATGLPFKGPENAPVTIAVFGDYQ